MSGPAGSGMALEDFLRAVLATSTGPNAMPYAPQSRWDIQQQLQQLQQVFPSLAVRTSDYHANDGRMLHLLKADGTIPIHYQGNKYNIPIVIWLTARFPDEPPLAYVTPTPTMVIKSPHQHVDRNGQVSCDALRNWKRQTSNLVDLCLDMSHVFGVDPPLYSQPPSAAPNQSSVSARPMSGPQPTTQPPPGYPSYGFAAAANPYGNAQQPPTPGANSNLGPRPASNPPSITTPAYPPPGQTSNSYTAGTTPTGQPDVATLAAANPLWGAAFASTLPSAKPPAPAFNQQPQALQTGGPSTSSDGPGRSSTPPTPSFPGSLFGQAMMNQQQQPQQGGYPPPGYADGAYGLARPPPPPPQKSDLEARFRPLALQALKLQVEAAQKGWAERVAAETNRVLEEQRALSDRRAQLHAMVASLKAERLETEGLVSEMGGKQAQLVAWLARNEPKAAAWKSMTEGGQAINWDKVLPAADELCRQALETQAIDLAAEDAVLALDKAMQAGLSGMTADAYLKQVRLLGRKQFFARALALKVADAQRVQPAPSPRPGLTAQPMSRPMPVAHGDTWTYATDASARAVGRR